MTGPRVILRLNVSDVSIIRIALRDKAKAKRHLGEKFDVHGMFGFINSNLTEALSLERIGDYLRSAILRNARDEPEGVSDMTREEDHH